MIKLIVCVLVIFFIIFLIYRFTSTQENFYASSCEDLNKGDGLVCSIPNSPLYSNKCYKVKQTQENPDGEYEHVNVDFCTDYPGCKEIGEKCDASNISKLANGYVERW